MFVYRGSEIQLQVGEIQIILIPYGKIVNYKIMSFSIMNSR